MPDVMTTMALGRRMFKFQRDWEAPYGGAGENCSPRRCAPGHLIVAAAATGYPYVPRALVVLREPVPCAVRVRAWTGVRRGSRRGAGAVDGLLNAGQIGLLTAGQIWKLVWSPSARLYGPNLQKVATTRNYCHA